jgi:sulfatase maturation enzyme AslB (radical SAM superfamily)
MKLLKKYIETSTNLILSKPGLCEGCRFAYYSDEPQKGDVTQVRFNHVMLNPHQWFCNLKCKYCAWFGEEHLIPDNVKEPYKLSPLIKFLIKNKLLTYDCQFSWGGGESTILPEFDILTKKICDNGYKQVLNSNGVRFSQAWAYVLSKDTRSYFNISPDSGTREGYLKTKRADYFDIVWDNIAKYMEASKNPTSFRVKYIIQDENCSDTEIAAFVRKCMEAGIKLIEISVEQTKTKDGVIPDAWIHAARYLQALAKKNGMNTVHMTLWNPRLGEELDKYPMLF